MFLALIYMEKGSLIKSAFGAADEQYRLICWKAEYCTHQDELQELRSSNSTRAKV